MRKSGVMWLLTALIVAGLTVGWEQPVAANSGWFTGDAPIITHRPLDTDRYDAHLSAALARYPADTCTLHEVPMMPEPTGPRSATACWYETAVGLLSQNSHLIRPPGQPYAGNLATEGELIATPSPTVALESVHGTFRFWTSPHALQPYTGTDSLQYYAWNEPPAAVMQTEQGDIWPAGDSLAAGHLAYAEDHAWAAIWDSRGYVLVVHLTDLSVRTIRLSETTGDQTVALAISNGGHLLGVSGRSTRRQVIMLDGCATAHRAVVSAPASCPHRELDSLPAGEPAGAYYELPHFFGQNMLGFYIDTGGKRQEYLVHAPDSALQHYTALGDSFASGEGANDYFSETALPGINMCHTSNMSYPYLLAASTGAFTVHSVACSGARSWHVSKRSQWPERPSNDTMGSWLPGFQPQVAYLQADAPDAITLSVIGNDVGFANKLKRCLEPDTCFASYEDRLELLREIDRQFEPLKSLYAQIQRTTPESRLYVMGYPSVIAPRALCEGWQPVGFSAKEAEFANTLTNTLNTLIRQAAVASGVTYVDVGSALDGHRLCEAHGSEAGINAITLGDDTLSLPGVGPILSNNSFHPTARGHQLLASTIAKQTDDLSLPRPLPDSLATLPDETDNPLLEAPSSGRDVRDINYDDDLANDVIYRGGVWQLIYDAPQTGVSLRPASLVTAWVNSEPRQLATLTTDVTGALNTTLTWPADLPEGFHTLHLYATASDGRAVDIYKTVYISAATTPGSYKNVVAPSRSGLRSQLANTGGFAWAAPVATGLIIAALVTRGAGRHVKRYVRH